MTLESGTLENYGTFHGTKQLIYIAENEETGDLLGFVYAAADVPKYNNEFKDWGIIIDNLHIHPQHRGQGIGKALLR